MRSASSPRVSSADAGVPGVATLSTTGGVVSGMVVGVDSGIGPQPASSAKRATTAITDGPLFVLVMKPSTAARSRGRFNLHLPRREIEHQILISQQGARRQASPAAWKGAYRPRPRAIARPPECVPVFLPGRAPQRGDDRRRTPVPLLSGPRPPEHPPILVHLKPRLRWPQTTLQLARAHLPRSLRLPARRGGRR